MDILEFRQVSYEAGGSPILHTVSFQAEENDFIAIVGASGSGKSTLLKLAGDLLSPSAGNLFYKEKDYREWDPIELRQQVMLCFQNPCLFGETVKDDLLFPFHIRKQKPDMKRIAALMEEFEMDNKLLDQVSATLSGGEKQRIALIRSLMFEPEVLLLDEVTSALDENNTRIVEEAIKRRHENGTLILQVTHNPEQSRRLANRIFTMKEGRITAQEVIR